MMVMEEDTGFLPCVGESVMLAFGWECGVECMIMKGDAQADES